MNNNKIELYKQQQAEIRAYKTKVVKRYEKQVETFIDSVIDITSETDNRLDGVLRFCWKYG